MFASYRYMIANVGQHRCGPPMLHSDLSQIFFLWDSHIARIMDSGISVANIKKPDTWELGLPKDFNLANGLLVLWLGGSY